MYSYNLLTRLEEEYPHILNAIRAEGYNIDYEEYDVFNEICLDGEVVGFITLSQFTFVNNYIAVNELYIIPEARGNGLALSQIYHYFVYDNFKFFLTKPTRAMVEFLLAADLAVKISPTLVYSFIPMVVDSDDLYRNPKIKRFYRTAEVNVSFTGNLYDLNLCSVMFFDEHNMIIRYEDFPGLGEPRKYDLKKYKLRRKLKKVTEKYLDDKYMAFRNKHAKIEEFNNRCSDEIDEFLGVDNILGSSDELSEKFLMELEEHNLSAEDGIKIKEHILKGLDDGTFSKRSYITRLKYLYTHFEIIDRRIGEFDETVEVCPFCKADISEFMASCSNCGLKIRDIDFEEQAVQNINEDMDEFFRDIDNAYEKNSAKMLEIKDDDELKDLKEHYNDYLLYFEFGEIMKYYTGDALECADAFLADKIANPDDEFEDYFNYLKYYCDLSIFNDEYEDAVVYTIQMGILASNQGTLMGDNVHMADIFISISKITASDKSYDIEKLFKRATDTFKFDKFNNNPERVFNFFQRAL